MANTFADVYRAAQEMTGGACPIAAGVIGCLADHECRHGRLPGDHSPPCGCWPEEGAAIVALRGIEAAERDMPRRAAA